MSPVRLAVAVAVLLAIGALAATFLPSTSSNGASCGTWVAPEFNAADIADLTESSMDLADLQDAGGDSDAAFETIGTAQAFQTAFLDCSGSLGTRRTVTLSLLLMLLVIPAGIVWTTRRRT